MRLKYKPYLKYKDSGIEWLGQIPEHWEVKRLKYQLRLLTGKTDRRKHPVALENIESWTGKFIPTDTEFKGEGIAFIANDILFGKLRPYLAKAYLTEFTGEAIGDFHVMRPIIKAYGRYILYQILCQGFISMVDSSTFGAKMPRVSWDFMSNIVLNTPSISEQKIIASFLDYKIAQIDTLVKKKQHQIELLKEKRAALITHAVTKGLDPNVKMKDSRIEWLGEIPEHWYTIKLNRCTVKIGSGITPRGGSEIYVDEGIPLIRSQNVQFEGLLLDNVVKITPDIHYQMSNSKVRQKDVLLNITGASIGRCCFVEVDGKLNVNQHVCIIRPNNKLENRYLNYCLQSDIGQEQVIINITGGNREGLTFNNIKSFVIPCLEYDTQEKISDYLDNAIEIIEGLIKKIHDSIDKAEEYRASLITAAVTGKIDVR